MLHTNARRHRPAFALPYIGPVPFAAEWPVADIAVTLAPDQHRRRLLFRPYKRRRLLFLSPPPSPPGTATDPQNSGASNQNIASLDAALAKAAR